VIRLRLGASVRPLWARNPLMKFESLGKPSEFLCLSSATRTKHARYLRKLETNSD
jgi:hypothetical protein